MLLLTTVEMLPVFLCEGPLLAVLRPSDRLGGGGPTANTGELLRMKSRGKKTIHPRIIRTTDVLYCVKHSGSEFKAFSHFI